MVFLTCGKCGGRIRASLKQLPGSVTACPKCEHPVPQSVRDFLFKTRELYLEGIKTVDTDWTIFLAEEINPEVDRLIRSLG